MLKRIVLLRFLMTAALSLSVTLPSRADTNLLAHWNFDQIENNVIKDVAGNNDGTVIGKWQGSNLRPGLHGNALYFGDMVNPHKIELKSTEAISLTDNFTVECIIKPEIVTGYRTIMWKGNRNVSPEAINYDFDIRDGKPEMKFKDAKGEWIVYSTAEPVLEADHWYRLIFTKQNDNIDIYVNGTKYSVKRSEDGKGVNLLPNEYSAHIGAGASSHSSSENYLFNGLIDDIKIYRGIEVNIPGDFQSQWQRLLSKNKIQTMLYVKVQAECEAERKKKLHREYSAFFKHLALKDSTPFAVRILPSAKRLVKTADFFKRLGNSSNIVNICAARNEYEGFNVIVLGNPAQDIQINEVNISDLVNVKDGSRISSNNITLGCVKDVITTDSGIPVDFVGAIPDVIMNGITTFNVKKDSFTPAFVKVYTGNASPGRYKGTIEFKGDGYSDKIDVNLQVYDFTLPEKGSLRTALSFFDSYYKQWYGIDNLSDKQKEYIHDFLLSYRLSPNNIYSSASITPDLKSLEEIKDRTNFFTIKGYGNSKLLPEDALSRQVKSVGDTIEKVKQAGMLDDMYYYSYDELAFNSTPTRLAAVKQINSALMKAYPELRLMQTSFPNMDIKDSFNAWVPLFNYFGTKEELSILNRLKKRGDEIWWYAADGPQSPYPNFFLDYPVFDNRIISILSYMYDVDGLLYWCINREWPTNMDIRKQWPDANWKPYIYSVKTGVKKHRNGMGNFIYPGPSGQLLPSLRLENLRDGLEDYEYLKELERSIDKLEAADIKDKNALLAEAKTLLNVPDSVAISISKWSSNPEHLLEYRNHIGEVISRIHIELEQND